MPSICERMWTVTVLWITGQGQSKVRGDRLSTEPWITRTARGIKVNRHQSELSTLPTGPPRPAASLLLIQHTQGQENFLQKPSHHKGKAVTVCHRFVTVLSPFRHRFALVFFLVMCYNQVMVDFLIGFAGSRSLPPSAASSVGAVVSAVLASGAGVVAGCAVGADAAVVSAVLAAGAGSRLALVAAFGPGGAGACPVSAVGAVGAAAAAGAAVSWWAGGGAGVPLSARLAGRTRAVVARLAAAPRAGLVVFFWGRASRGSLLACRLALAAGVPVVAFFWGGCPPVSLPGVAWVPAGAGVWAGGWRAVVSV